MAGRTADTLDRRPDSRLFTVRVWAEELSAGSREWRGKAQHVLSGEARYFRRWEDLLDFLSAKPGRSTAGPDGTGSQFHAPVGQSALSEHAIPYGGDISMTEEFAQRHCLMVSQEASEGTPGSATIWYLDRLDDQDIPHSQSVVSQYAGFKLLGDDGWKLVQVIGFPSSLGMDGPMPATTEFYFNRPARNKG